MREASCTAVAAKNLFDLKASLKDIEMIDEVMKEIAAGTKVGYPIPLLGSLLGTRRKLYQYHAGRYKLNYTLTKTEATLVSVIV